MSARRVTRTCTPSYAAPEVLEGNEITPRSDLASLGYVLIEMLSGVPIFLGLRTYEDLINAKHRIVNHLFELLPREILDSKLLLELICGLVAPDPRDRFQSAEAADLVKETAKRLLRTHDLRAADGLQLAAALVVAEQRPATLEIVCRDRRLALAAEREGFEVL